MRSNLSAASIVRPSLWLGVLPAALIVAMSLPACSDTPDGVTVTDINRTDPTCRPMSCESLGKNCGTISDGCGASLRCGQCAPFANNDCRANVCERSCDSDMECLKGMSCVSGSCVDRCTSSQDCPSGQYCNTNVSPGLCTNNVSQYSGSQYSSGRSCTRDSNCGSNEVCRNSTCVSSTGNTCYRDLDCRSGESCISGYCGTNNNYGSGSGNRCTYDSDCGRYESCDYGYCRSDNGNDYYSNGNNNGRRVRAECVTREVGLTLPFGNVSFYSESWLYDGQNPRGLRVESCICQGTRELRLDLGDYSRSINCDTCVKDDTRRTCYE